MSKVEDLAKELGLPVDFRTWTEGQWLTIEKEAAKLIQEEEERDLPFCRLCGTKPSESNGYEERFCKCGTVHAVTKRKDRKNENEVVKELRA